MSGKCLICNCDIDDPERELEGFCVNCLGDDLPEQSLDEFDGDIDFSTADYYGLDDIDYEDLNDGEVDCSDTGDSDLSGP